MKQVARRRDLWSGGAGLLDRARKQHEACTAPPHTYAAEIRIWPFQKAPECIQRMAAGVFEWVAVVPAELATNEVESLFRRWESQDHPVVRRILPNGSVLLAGDRPTAETMDSIGFLTSGAKPAIGRNDPGGNHR